MRLPRPGAGPKPGLLVGKGRPALHLLRWLERRPLSLLWCQDLGRLQLGLAWLHGWPLPLLLLLLLRIEWRLLLGRQEGPEGSLPWHLCPWCSLLHCCGQGLR